MKCCMYYLHSNIFCEDARNQVTLFKTALRVNKTGSVTHVHKHISKCMHMHHTHTHAHTNTHTGISTFKLEANHLEMMLSSGCGQIFLYH